MLFIKTKYKLLHLHYEFTYKTYNTLFPSGLVPDLVPANSPLCRCGMEVALEAQRKTRMQLYYLEHFNILLAWLIH